MQPERLFPYNTFREGQRELAESVYYACKNKSKLVVEAMSGFGKTAPVLTGAVLAAEEDECRIIYACRTKRQVFRVAEEIQRIQTKVPLRAAQLFAKIDYCLLKERSTFKVNQESFRWYCSFNTSNNLCSYFLNLSLANNQALALVRKMNDRIPAQPVLMQECRRVHVCPYEVAKLAMMESRIVATTYHYLLDERAQSPLFSATALDSSKSIAIIDEAHNLRDFMRGLSTIELSFADIRRAQYDAESLHLELSSFLIGLAESLRVFHRQLSSWRVDRESLLDAIKGPHDDAWLPSVALELLNCAGTGWQSVSSGRNLSGSIMKIGTFLQSLLFSAGPGHTITKSDEGFQVVNCDTSHFAEQASRYRSLILLSATINPCQLFLKSIGLDETTQVHRVNPNHVFNVLTLIDTGVSTRFRLRTAETWSRIATKISAISDCIKGNIGIFLPSYVVLESVVPFLWKVPIRHQMIIERKGLSNVEAGELIDSFKSNPRSMLIAVQGAHFSEGEDFPGDQMDVSVVVGFSLPPPSPMLYAELSNPQFGKHEAYLITTLLPALRKAVQAAGRHIRSPDKKGIVFLMDSRFNQPEVLRMIPDWLKTDMRTGDFEPVDIIRMLNDFSKDQ